MNALHNLVQTVTAVEDPAAPLYVVSSIIIDGDWQLHVFNGQPSDGYYALEYESEQELLERAAKCWNLRNIKACSMDDITDHMKDAFDTGNVSLVNFKRGSETMQLALHSETSAHPYPLIFELSGSSDVEKLQTFDLLLSVITKCRELEVVTKKGVEVSRKNADLQKDSDGLRKQNADLRFQVEQFRDKAPNSPTKSAAQRRPPPANIAQRNGPGRKIQEQAFESDDEE